MNSIFRGFPSPTPMSGNMGGMGIMGGNPMMNAMNMMNQIQQLKQNPSGIVDFLKNSGRLNNDQLQAISNMKSPNEIGQYLMNGIPQNMRGQVQNQMQNMANQVFK